ncbi:MAG: hypothetical protein HONBIEJF_03050 [Fimbriimonadaceae bacterium]|nr:hypothetical protein [Fimbriimonadaceae bacterium]
MLAFMNDKQGQRTTVFLCDVCHCPITDLREAIVVHKDVLASMDCDERESRERCARERVLGQELMIVHKNTCDPGRQAPSTEEREMHRSWDELLNAIAEALLHTGARVPEEWLEFGRPARIP